ncbi:MAG: zinc-ribbon domain-containing protein, partial [Chloroflexi bacterium]
VDNAWLLWDKDAQTLHDKVVATVVVKAKGSEKIVEAGGLGAPPAGVTPPPAYAPPVSFPASSPPASPQARGTDEVFCKNCGRAVKADAQFCPNCGASVTG